MTSKHRRAGKHLLAAGLGALLLSFAATGYSQQNGGLKTAVAVDLLADFGDHNEDLAAAEQPSNELQLRSAEFMFYAPIDHLFDGKLSFAAHPEGDTVFGQPEVHEAYLASSKLIPRSRFKIGQFFLGVGRINHIHQHDWPFLSTPLTQLEAFNAAEGVIDTGVEYSVLLDLPFYLDWTVGVTSGRSWGHAHEKEERPLTPTHYSKLTTYTEMIGLPTQIGLSSVGRTNADDQSMQLVGLDLVSKKRHGRLLRWLWQAEIWRESMQPAAGEETTTVSAYVYGQFGFNVNWSSGLRLDYASVTTASDNSRTVVEWNLGYQASEFAKIRLAYHQDTRRSQRTENVSSQRLLLQSTFIIGAHPTHEF
jgi:hypothetical protein